ncbi:MAG: PTS sugar transporter subunit IIA [Gammaproteobacteria bacterium]|nr:PTS sugar transporter subunit IIA [Gammaproteobacteria bacterium]
MSIGDILTTDRIRTDVKVSSKKKALEIISELLAGDGEPLSPRAVSERLVARERLGSTALGHGVAIPHGRVSGAPEAVAAFVKLTEGVDFESPDGQPVDLIIGLLVPEECNDCHLQLLAQLAEVFSQTSIRDALRSQVTPADVWEILNRAAIHS